MAKVSSVTFGYVLKALEKNTNIKLEEMLVIVDLTLDEISNQDLQIDSKKLSDVFIFCMQKTNDFTLSLSIGKSVSYHSLGLLGYLLLNTDTLFELIEKFNYYQKLISGFMKFHFEENGNYFKLAIYINENPNIPVPSFHAEVHLSAIISILTQISGKKVFPEFTYFSNEYRGDLNKYEEIFGRRIYFSKDENAIFFKKDKLNIAIENSNPAMLAFFEVQANKILENQSNESVYSKIKKEILKNIGEKEITIDFISKNIKMSSRTLQYNLKNEGKTFREAYTEVRMHLANHYIKNSKMDINSISYFLGYSDSSSFCRAYKKYYGFTPLSSKL